MKRIIFFGLFLLISCTKDSVQEQIDDNLTPTDDTEEFTLFVNGQNQGLIDANFTRTENLFNHLGGGIINFTADGKLSLFKIRYNDPNNGTSKDFQNYSPNSQHFFNFSLTNLNEVKKTFKISFSGYVYANPLNLNSESKYVNGEVKGKYVDRIPFVFGITHKAKINNVLWEKTYGTTQVIPGATPRVIKHDFDNGLYKIEIHFNHGVVSVGNYNFSNSDISNKIVVMKYNMTTHTYEKYIGTGSLNFLSVDGIYRGVYQFNGNNENNPEDVIQVTEGSFKFKYP